MALAELKVRMGDLYKMGRAAQVLSWEQQTYMPPGGAKDRAEQMAALNKIAHQIRISDETAKLLEAAEQEVEGMAAESEDLRYVQRARYEFDRFAKLPPEFTERSSKITGVANSIWREARAENNFGKFYPELEKMFELAREKAEYIGYSEQPYDALLDDFERGMLTRDVATTFAELRDKLVPLVQAIAEKSDTVRDEVVHGDFPANLQRQFGEWVIKQFGFDFERGRQDEAPHPFCNGFNTNDVRITTRFDPTWVSMAMFGTFHETGHGLYEQGFPQAWQGNLLSGGASLGVHESQSRMWENLVGRSKGFWQYAYGELQNTFPSLQSVDLETFYKAINMSKPSFIRVEADEVTYNLHIMLRFDLETAVLKGDLPVKDLRDAWNDKMKEYLGIVPANDTEGILQDIHWSWGLVGYFATYSLGNLLSVQFYNQAVAENPAIPQEISQGKFDTLLNWNRTNIHQHGRKYPPKELIERVTGTGIQVQPYMDYLTEKYSEIYNL